MAVRTPGFMERMAKYGLGIVKPHVGITVLAQVMSFAYTPVASRFNQHALFTGKFLSSAKANLGQVMDIRCPSL